MTGIQFPAGATVGFLLFSTASRPVLGSTQTRIQWVAGDSFPRDKAARAWSWPLTSI